MQAFGYSGLSLGLTLEKKILSCIPLQLETLMSLVKHRCTFLLAGCMGFGKTWVSEMYHQGCFPGTCIQVLSLQFLE
ncbi:hypothetical protein VP01_1374g1 [Puccinia sorghi]|uniref:Uncharacterized protein n=1 Tax=Puccinia sorghi TaxID=27349 RepID=A0A0L6VM42_9BASI|nr:hypothetical protein VP01_1374g1 [Puccinia sorghi]